MNTDYIPDTLLKDANRLKISVLQSKDIKDSVIWILRCINDEITVAYNNSENEINYVLPSLFGIKNMDETTAHREICSRILDALDKKNYKVKYLMKKEGRMLKIKWSDYDKDDLINYQNDVIKRHIYN